jgi:hypothetical protein
MANYLTVIHECKDFAAWRKGYDADLSARTAAGLTELYVVREHANPNMIGLVFEASDVARAQAMVASPELADRMKAAGVIGTPKVRIRHGDFKRQSAANYATIATSHARRLSLTHLGLRNIWSRTPALSGSRNDITGRPDCPVHCFSARGR